MKGSDREKFVHLTLACNEPGRDFIRTVKIPLGRTLSEMMLSASEEAAKMMGQFCIRKE